VAGESATTAAYIPDAVWEASARRSGGSSTAAAASLPGDAGSALVRVLAGLLVVGGLVVATGYAVKRFGLAGRLGAVPAHRRRMQLIEQIGLSPKARVAAVRIGDQVLVLGHGEGGIRSLAQFSWAQWDGEAALVAPVVTDPVVPAAPMPPASVTETVTLPQPTAPQPPRDASEFQDRLKRLLAGERP
jgi:flagellar biogenesis protein FliO